MLDPTTVLSLDPVVLAVGILLALVYDVLLIAAALRLVRWIRIHRAARAANEAPTLQPSTLS